jgi:hypothetical protein
MLVSIPDGSVDHRHGENRNAGLNREDGDYDGKKTP